MVPQGSFLKLRHRNGFAGFIPGIEAQKWFCRIHSWNRGSEGWLHHILSWKRGPEMVPQGSFLESRFQGMVPPDSFLHLEVSGSSSTRLIHEIEPILIA